MSLEELPSYACQECTSVFTFRGNLHRHIRNIHGRKDDNALKYDKTLKSRIKCPKCLAETTRYSRLREHLEKTHDINLHYEEAKFNTEEDFQQWKQKYETENVSFYFMDTSPKHMVNGDEKRFYHCHRSYQFKSKGYNKRVTKSSNKIGKCCPSGMELLIRGSNEYVVKFWTTHVGHSPDIGRHFREKEKLSQRVSFQHILDNIRDNLTKEEGVQHIHLTQRKDLQNMCRDLNASCATKCHENDAISIRLWVNEMKDLKDDCPVLYYKEQNKKDEANILDINDLALILMTKFQTEQLKRYGHERICIDGTHGTDAYKLNLYSLVTVDEYASGCPVAFCFSNKSDEKIFKLFFSYVKQRVCNINAKVFMSDDEPAFYNAWLSTMGSVPHPLLSAWNVDQNWRQNLSRVRGGREKRVLVYQALRTLLQTTSVDDFKKYMDQILMDFLSDPDTVAFGNYFRNNYASRPQLWAYCYRLYLGINTDMYLESLHKILMYIYLKGVRVKRLDRTVGAVLKIARDALFNRSIKNEKCVSSEKLLRVRTSHKASQVIESESIEVLSENIKWMVSSKVSSEKYIVSRIENVMCEDCVIICKQCNVCMHSFVCSCLDNMIRFNICKHIHACSRLNETIIDVEARKSNSKDCRLELTSMDTRRVSQVKSSSSNNESLMKKAELLKESLSRTHLNPDETRVASEALDKLINLVDKETGSFKTKQSIDQEVRPTKKKKFNTKIKKAVYRFVSR